MSFTVSIAESRHVVPAEPGDTVLSALLSHGVGFAYSCQAGICGSCKCELVSGEILELECSEHALSAQERSRNIVLACRSQVWSDVVVRRLEEEEFIAHPSRVMRCRVEALERATHDVILLRLSILAGGPYTFSAGQYARLQFPFARGIERDYSMANAADEDLLEFHIRIMPDGAVSSRVAQKLKVGDEVRVSGPFGTAYWRSQHAGPILCIAGGTGLAPLQSIVETVLRSGAANPVRLYFGVRAERDVYGEALIDRWQRRHPDFRAHVVLSEAGAGHADGTRLPRRIGLVTDAVAEDFADLAGYKVYMAGPPAMVDAASELVRARGVAPRDLHADAFYPAPAETSLTGTI
jgi:CDP-4-dehydro-6-deoxyglucose reductase/ferredoxin-NAD(P)+ reductase (naphthalene dioxygenase ferredoxin-specific)